MVSMKHACRDFYFSSRMLRILVVTLALSPAYVIAAQCPTEVRVGFPDFPVSPLLNGTTALEEIPGDLVVWTRNALAGGDCKPIVSIRRLPLNRLVAELRAKTVDVVPGVGPALLSTLPLAFPMRGTALDSSLIIVRDRLWIYVRDDDNDIRWDGTRLNVQNPRIGISAGIMSTKIAADKQGWIIDVAKNPESNLTKLSSHRIDAIVESELWLQRYLNTTPSVRANIRKLEPPLVTVERYAPTTIDFYRKYPEYTQQFWHSMRQQSEKGK